MTQSVGALKNLCTGLKVKFIAKYSISIPFLLLHFFCTPTYANSNHTVSWKAFDTPHFQILFHDDVAPQARLARDFLETAYARITSDLGMRERGIIITVVLTGVPDESNGNATPVGHRIIIFTRPMQVLTTGDIAWMKRVLAHELTHQITFLTLRKTFWGLYSEIYKTAYLPAWFLEGLAQYEAETWDAKRNTFFAHVLYNSALEAYPELATFTKSDPVSGRLVYEQGHAFVRFLVARQGEDFLPELLARIRVIPFWTELKYLLSPITGSILPLEDAIGAKTGVGIRQLYREFTDSLRVGMPDKVPMAPALRGGVPGFAAVFQLKIIDSTSFVFTGQREWDRPTTSLFISRRGKVSGIGLGHVNPVFDLSPDRKKVLYVRTHIDWNGDERERLYAFDLAGGHEVFISEGADHPIFFGNDSIAFSHYSHGRQRLTLCIIRPQIPVCLEVAADSLSGLFGLSRSRQGILLNATDTAGRTGIYEFVSGAGFTKLLSDSVHAEFPVEASDGSILMLRDRGGLLQVDALDRATGMITPAKTFPLGTFYLHQSAPGTISAVAQTLGDGQWSIQPSEIPEPDSGFFPHDSLQDGPVSEADSIPPTDSLAGIPIDTVAVYVKPGFLSGSIPEFASADSTSRPAPARTYYSLLGLRPLIGTPFIARTFEGAALGANVFLQDPLEMHTLTVTGGLAPDGDLYGFDYYNQQTPVGIQLSATNDYLDVERIPVPTGWDKLYVVSTATILTAGLRIPIPVALPYGHSVSLGLRATVNLREYSLAGIQTGDSVVTHYAWRKDRMDTRYQTFLGYQFFSPYAYQVAHPLLATVLEIGLAPNTNGMDLFMYARQTFPIWSELTFTARFSGEHWSDEAHLGLGELPGSQTAEYLYGGRQGGRKNAYISLDVPLHKGFITELPVFGLWNYLGGSLFGSFTRTAYEEQNIDHTYTFSPYATEQTIVGGKISGLFHIMRRSPLVLAFSCGYDLNHDERVFRLQTEFSGLPSSLSLSPKYAPGLGEARKHSL